MQCDNQQFIVRYQWVVNNKYSYIYKRNWGKSPL